MRLFKLAVDDPRQYRQKTKKITQKLTFMKLVKIFKNLNKITIITKSLHFSVIFHFFLPGSGSAYRRDTQPWIPASVANAAPICSDHSLILFEKIDVHKLKTIMTRVRKGCRSRKCNKSLLNYLLSIRLIMKGLAEHFNDLMYRPIMITSMRTVFTLYAGVFLDLI